MSDSLPAHGLHVTNMLRHRSQDTPSCPEVSNISWEEAWKEEGGQAVREVGEWRSESTCLCLPDPQAEAKRGQGMARLEKDPGARASGIGPPSWHSEYGMMLNRAVS